MGAAVIEVPQSHTSPCEGEGRHSRAYRAELRKLAPQISNKNWETLLAEADGAHPLELAGAARELRPDLTLSPAQISCRSSEAPELHWLEDEWYFTEQTSQALADEFLSTSRSLALGCPTVVRQAARGGRRRPLIDASASLPARLRREGLPDPMSADLRRPLPNSMNSTFDAVLLDPPWHLDDMLSWLSAAGALTRPGGAIAFPLYGALTKPRASAERDAILRAAESLGRVQLLPRAVRYATPFFEEQAMAAAGVPAPRDWRVADLLTITRRDNGWCFTLPPWRGHEQWHTWILEEQVVKLRHRPTHAGPQALSPLPGTIGHVVPSVSRRWGGFADAGIVTSRQRAASVAQPTHVARWLNSLAQHRRQETCDPLLLALLQL